MKNSDSSQSARVLPARNVLGSVAFPGDKSISHRYGMLAALAAGTSRFRNFSTGADCASTLSCMEALGAKITASGGMARSKLKARPGRCSAPSQAARLRQLGLDDAHAVRDPRCTKLSKPSLTGDASLSRRPMRRIVDPCNRWARRSRPPTVTPACACAAASCKPSTT